MTTLYDVLGVPKDAPPQLVKAAFRARAKQLHPDAGCNGNISDFEILVRANRILSNPATRKRYDEFGYVDERPEEKKLTDAWLLLQNALAANLPKITDVTAVDLVMIIRAQVDDSAAKGQAAMNQAQTQIDRLIAIRDRLQVKRGLANRFARMIQGQINQAKEAMGRAQEQLDTHDLALQLLEDYNYLYVRRQHVISLTLS